MPTRSGSNSLHGKRLPRFVSQLRFRGNAFLLAGQDLRAGATSATNKGADRRAFTAAEQRAQHSTDSGAATHVLRGPFVGAQSGAAAAGALSASSDEIVARAVHRDGTQVEDGVFAIGRGLRDEASARAARDRDPTLAVRNVIADARRISGTYGRLRGNGGVGPDLDLGVRGNGAHLRDGSSTRQQQDEGKQKTEFHRSSWNQCRGACKE